MTRLRTGRIAGAALLAVLLGAPGVGRAEEPLPQLRLSVVSQTATNWVLYAGVANGDFKKEGVDLSLSVAGSSPKLVAGLDDGSVDVASMAAGHVLDGVQSGKDLFIVMALNRPVFSLVSTAKYAKVSDLRGAVIGVDQGRTGYVYLVRSMLKDAGIGNDEYRINDVGGVEARYKALLAGEIDVALMTVPQDLLAVEKGYKILAQIEYKPEEYTGSVAVARRAWASAHKGAVVSYVRGYRRAIDWLYDPKNEDAAVKILLANVPVSEPIAHRIYRDTLVAKGWLLKDAQVKATGLAAVARQMELESAPEDPAWLARFVDTSYQQAALAGR